MVQVGYIEQPGEGSRGSGLVIVVFSGAVGTVDLPGVAVDGVKAEGLEWTSPNGHQFSHVWVSSHYSRFGTAHTTCMTHGPLIPRMFYI